MWLFPHPITSPEVKVGPSLAACESCHGLQTSIMTRDLLFIDHGVEQLQPLVLGQGGGLGGGFVLHYAQFKVPSTQVVALASLGWLSTQFFVSLLFYESVIQIDFKRIKKGKYVLIFEKKLSFRLNENRSEVKRRILAFPKFGLFWGSMNKVLTGKNYFD